MKTSPVEDVADDLDCFLRDLHGCRQCSSHRPGFPIPPHGRIRRAQGIDILLVGWNPQLRGTPDAQPDFQTWCAQAERALEEAHTPFRNLVGRLLPDGYDLADGRVANTRVWKWPTATKHPSDRQLARTCAAVHLWREVEVLRPRLVLTYDKDAAEFFLAEANARGIPVLAPAPVGRRVVRGYTLPHDGWGWRLAVLAATGIRDKSRDEVDYIQATGAALLDAR